MSLDKYRPNRTLNDTVTDGISYLNSKSRKIVACFLSYHDFWSYSTTKTGTSTIILETMKFHENMQGGMTFIVDCFKAKHKLLRCIRILLG